MTWKGLGIINSTILGPFSMTSLLRTSSKGRHGMQRKQNAVTVCPNPAISLDHILTFISAELIPKEHWEVPSWINDELFKESTKILEENNIQYGNKISYHQMCRW